MRGKSGNFVIDVKLLIMTGLGLIIKPKTETGETALNYVLSMLY